MTDELPDQMHQLLHGLADAHAPASPELFEKVAADVRTRRSRHIAVAAVAAVVVLLGVGVPALATSRGGARPASGPVAVTPGSTDCPSSYHLPGSTFGPATPGTATLPKLTAVGAVRATVCRYSGLSESSPVGTLAYSADLGAVAAANLSTQMAAAVPSQLRLCTSNRSDTALVVFGYPDGSISRVSMILFGCGIAFPAGGGPPYQLSNAAVAAVTAASGATSNTSSPPATPGPDSPPPASTSVASPPSTAASSAELSAVPESPDALAIAPDGTLYIADPIENAIYKRTASGAFSVVAGTGIAGFTGDGGPATAAELNDPSGMLLEPDGTLLFADGMNNRLRAIAPDGRISTVAGNGKVASVTRPGTATAEPVADPKDVATDPHGGYYIATISQILHLSTNGQLTVVAGNAADEGLAGIGGPALSGSVDGPGSIAVDHTGGIYVAGQNTKDLLYITPAGTLTKVGDGFYARGWGGLRPAPDGSVVGINTLELVRYRSGVPTTIYDFSSTTAPALHNMLLNGLAVSPTGDIYVSSDGNSGFNSTPTLVRIDPAGKPTVLWTLPRHGASASGVGSAPASVQTSPPAAGSGTSYVPYTNARFGFTLEVPASLAAEQPPIDGDGQSYDGDGGLVVLTVFGGPNVSAVAPSSIGSWIDGETVTSHTVDGPVSVATGTFQDQGRTMIAYARTVVGVGSLNVLEWTYPASEGAALSAEVTHTAATFRPGDLAVVH
jgi:sugar lactone lactonase YvrE